MADYFVRCSYTERVEFSKMSSGEKLLADAISCNDDLLTEILVCLPVKSLLRFKIVSKHWQSLISSPHFFRRLYPDRHVVSGLIFHKGSSLSIPEHGFIPLKNTPVGAPFESLRSVNHPSGVRILQSCNGLLLFSCWGDKITSENDYFICNPITKQSILLPRPRARGGICGMSLAYDPGKSPHYKAVCVGGSDSLEGHYYQIEIYSSETRSWKISGDPFTAHSAMLLQKGVSWNGAIHWIDRHDDASLYFKVDEEQLGAMPVPTTPVPEKCRCGRRFRYFGESRGHLHIVEGLESSVETRVICGTRFEVYEMERDHSKWLMKYLVDLDAMTLAFPEMTSSILSPAVGMDYYKFSILSIIREANDEDSYMVLHIPGRTIRYNFCDKSFDTLCVFGSGEDGVQNWDSLVQWVDVYQYIETHACV